MHTEFLTLGGEYSTDINSAAILCIAMCYDTMDRKDIWGYTTLSWRSLQLTLGTRAECSGGSDNKGFRPVAWALEWGVRGGGGRAVGGLRPKAAFWRRQISVTTCVPASSTIPEKQVFKDLIVAHRLNSEPAPFMSWQPAEPCSQRLLFVSCPGPGRLVPPSLVLSLCS